MGLTSLNNYSGLWGIGLSLIVWNLPLEPASFGQVYSGPECKSQIRKVVGGVDFGLIGLYLKSISPRRGLLLRRGDGEGGRGLGQGDLGIFGLSSTRHI